MKDAKCSSVIVAIQQQTANIVCWMAEGDSVLKRTH